MNKMLLSAVMLGIAVLLGSMAYVSVVNASDSDECKLKYPNDEVGQRINCGEIGIPNNHENQ